MIHSGRATPSGLWWRDTIIALATIRRAHRNVTFCWQAVPEWTSRLLLHDSCGHWIERDEIAGFVAVGGLKIHKIRVPRNKQTSAEEVALPCFGRKMCELQALDQGRLKRRANMMFPRRNRDREPRITAISSQPGAVNGIPCRLRT